MTSNQLRVPANCRARTIDVDDFANSNGGHLGFRPFIPTGAHSRDGAGDFQGAELRF
jgi:hypothetical protein